MDYKTMEAFGGKANPSWLIEQVNELYRDGHIQGEVQEGLIFAILGREDLEKQTKELEQKVEGLESTMLFLQSKLRQMNRPNYRVINRECLNAIKLIREGAENE